MLGGFKICNTNGSNTKMGYRRARASERAKRVSERASERASEANKRARKRFGETERGF